jgi:hypothetical protein
MMATMAEAHREWHWNSGTPIGLPCPWDACDPALLSEEEVQRLLKVQADNAAAEEAWADSPEANATCEHGMSAWLCEGPSHYGMDYGDDW